MILAKDKDYTDEVIHTEPMHGGYVYIAWMNPGSNRVGFVKKFKKIEKFIEENDLKGWLCHSEEQYKEMHGLIQKVGGTMYKKNGKDLFFVKRRKL